MHIIPIKQRLLILTSSIALVLILISVLIVLPTIKQILSLKNNITSIQGNLEERYEKTQRLKKSVSQLSQAKQSAEQFSQAAINPSDQLKSITELENLASQNNIEMTENVEYIDLGQNKDNDSNSDTVDSPVLPQYYHFSFLNNGSFRDHLAFLKKIENLPFYLIINNLKFEKKENGNSLSMPVSLTFDAIIYANNRP